MAAGNAGNAVVMDETVSAARNPADPGPEHGGNAVVASEGMLVAGLGCRAGVDSSQILAALDAALAVRALPRQAVNALATIPQKRNEPALGEAAETLGLPLLVPDAQALARVATLTRSSASLAATGFGSAAEACALAAAGQGAYLLGARVAVGPATCALACLDGSAP